jgi:hypothetical protein
LGLMDLPSLQALWYCDSKPKSGREEHLASLPHLFMGFTSRVVTVMV